MGNNNDKPKLRAGRPPKHGAYKFLFTGEVPIERQHLAQRLRDIEEGLIRDVGPTKSDLTTAQKLLLDRAVVMYGFLKLIEAHVAENGFFEGDRMAPSLRESYIAYSNSLRLTLRELGIDVQKYKEVFDVDQHVIETYVDKGEK